MAASKSKLQSFIRTIKYLICCRDTNVRGKGGKIIIISVKKRKVDSLNAEWGGGGSKNENAELRIHSAEETERALLLYLRYLRPWKGRNGAKIIESLVVLKGLTYCKKIASHEDPDVVYFNQKRPIKPSSSSQGDHMTRDQT